MFVTRTREGTVVVEFSAGEAETVSDWLWDIVEANAEPPVVEEFEQALRLALNGGEEA